VKGKASIRTAREHDRRGLVGLIDRFRAWMRQLYTGRKPRPAQGAQRPSRTELGREGELLAERHLRRSGYRLLARNFRAAGAEIDLIASDGGTIVFVEVKTRSDTNFGRPEEAVDETKQARIRRAAEIYLDRRRARDMPVRFDVVAITGRGPGRRVELFKDAF
jgi:putative endonuclease